jgi:hypothetical protein
MLRQSRKYTRRLQWMTAKGRSSHVPCFGRSAGTRFTRIATSEPGKPSFAKSTRDPIERLVNGTAWHSGYLGNVRPKVRPSKNLHGPGLNFDGTAIEPEQNGPAERMVPRQEAMELTHFLTCPFSTHVISAARAGKSDRSATRTMSLYGCRLEKWNRSREESMRVDRSSLDVTSRARRLSCA